MWSETGNLICSRRLFTSKTVVYTFFCCFIHGTYIRKTWFYLTRVLHILSYSINLIKNTFENCNFFGSEAAADVDNRLKKIKLPFFLRIPSQTPCAQEHRIKLRCSHITLVIIADILNYFSFQNIVHIMYTLINKISKS